MWKFTFSQISKIPPHINPGMLKKQISFCFLADLNIPMSLSLKYEKKKPNYKVLKEEDEIF